MTRSAKDRQHDGYEKDLKRGSMTPENIESTETATPDTGTGLPENSTSIGDGTGTTRRAHMKVPNYDGATLIMIMRSIRGTKRIARHARAFAVSAYIVAILALAVAIWK